MSLAGAVYAPKSNGTAGELPIYDGMQWMCYS